MLIPDYQENNTTNSWSNTGVVISATRAAGSSFSLDYSVALLL